MTFYLKDKRVIYMRIEIGNKQIRIMTSATIAVFINISIMYAKLNLEKIRLRLKKILPSFKEVYACG